jgi:multisubunit Na+/H+ antiporter MnhC subunit
MSAPLLSIFCFENGTFLAHQRQLEKLIIRFNLLKVVVFGLLVGKLS